MMQAQLGMIPSWQFSTDPGVNIKLNDHVRFPPGWTQRTIQPVGPAYAAPARIAQGNFDGLGLAAREPLGCCDGGPAPDLCCDPNTFVGRLQMMRNRGRARRRGMRGLALFDSWAYDNRKWLVLGGLGLIAAAGLGVTAAILK